MSRQRRNRLDFLLLATVTTMIAATRTGQAIDALPTQHDARKDEQCILLRNGNVLTGQVVRRGEDYTVMRNGATLHLASHQVEAVCENLAAAYTHRRRALDPHDVLTHLKLAEWCVKQGLVDEADEEIEAARRLDPKHPRLSIVQRRLAVARQPARTSVTETSATTETNQALAESDVVNGIPSNVVADAPPARTPLADYPEDTLEQFRRGIQPLLLNTCTTSGCHNASGEYTFVLDRRALWNDAPRELTIANLQAVLDRLNREAPLESRLVAAATAPHARSLAGPPITTESAALARLKEWVLHVTGHDKPQADPAEGEATSADEDTGETDEVDISDEELDALFFGEAFDPSRIRRNVRRGLQSKMSASTDPYDADEFNRRFSGKAQSQPSVPPQ